MSLQINSNLGCFIFVRVSSVVMKRCLSSFAVENRHLWIVIGCYWMFGNHRSLYLHQARKSGKVLLLFSDGQKTTHREHHCNRMY